MTNVILKIQTDTNYNGIIKGYSYVWNLTDMIEMTPVSVDNRTPEYVFDLFEIDSEKTYFLYHNNNNGLCYSTQSAHYPPSLLTVYSPTHETLYSDPVHEFTSNTIANQERNVPFQLTIRAQNENGNLCNFNGVTFLSYKANPLAPNLVDPIFAQFVDGIANLNVKFTQPLNTIFISISGANIESHTNYFNVS